MILRFLSTTLALLLAACSTTLPPEPAAPPPIPPSLSSSVWGLTRDGHVVCGSVAVAPDTVITSAHCLLPGVSVLRSAAGHEILATVKLLNTYRDIGILTVLPEYAHLEYAELDHEPWEGLATVIRPIRGWRHDTVYLHADTILSPIDFGDSGSPLFVDGHVVGLVMSCYFDGQHCKSTGGKFTAVFPLPL